MSLNKNMNHLINHIDLSTFLRRWYTNRRPGLACALLLASSLTLAACRASEPTRPALMAPAVQAQPSLPPVTYQPKLAPFARLQAQDHGAGKQKLQIQLVYPSAQSGGFRTQAFGCGEVAAARIQVSGPGLSSPIYADGSDPVTHQIAAVGCNLTATLSAVPYGSLIVQIQLYDAQGNFLTGSELKGAVRLSSGSQNLELSYRQMAAAHLLEKLLQGPVEDQFLAEQLDLSALQSLLDTIMQVAGSFPNYTFSHHPSLLNLTALIDDLKAHQGNVALLNPAKPQYIQTAGSARLNLNGYLLTQPVDISIDDTLSPNVQVNANGQVVIANVPPGNWQIRLSGPGYLPRRIPVTVTDNAQTDLSTVSIYPPQPSLSSLSPNAGVAGSSITLTGTNFNTTALANNQVLFGSTPATVTAATSTSLTVTVPTGLTGSNQAVTVTIGAANPTASVNYTVMRPLVSSLAPAFGPIGGTVLINGSNFNGTIANNLVRFGSTPATVTAATPTQLSVTVPNGLSGQVPITVQNLLSPFSDPVMFDLTPTLTGTTPNTGSFDDVVTLTGTGFSSTLGSNTVRFGGSPATVTAASNTSLSVKVPDNVAGAQNITVQVGSQTSASAAFTVRPTISALSTLDTIAGKAALIRGQLLTITGRHFDLTAANNSVQFGAISTPAVSVNATGTQLTVWVPAGVDIPGDISVHVISNSQSSNSLTAAVPGVNVTINGGFK